MWIAPESGERIPGESETLIPGVEVSAAELLRGKRLKEMVAAATMGSLPTGRPLKPWEPSALGPQHLCWIFDRAQGMQGKEIAERYGVQQGRVSVILNHPYAEMLLGELLSVSADRIADPVARMQAFTHEMINVKLELVRNPETHQTLRNDIASDFLDRAGYGVKRQIDAKVEHSFRVPAAAASRLVEALDESNRIQDVDYSQHVVRSRVAPELQEGEVLSLASGHGQPKTSDGISPDALPATPSELDIAKAEEKEFLAEQRKRRTA